MHSSTKGKDFARAMIRSKSLTEELMLDAIRHFFLAVLVCGWIIAFQYAAELLIAHFISGTTETAAITTQMYHATVEVSESSRALLIVRPQHELPPIRAPVYASTCQSPPR